MIFNKPQAINTTNLRTKFHEDWAINVTSRVLTSKAAPPPGGHIFQQTKTIFILSLAIIKNKNWTINVTPRVLTSKTAMPPWRPCFFTDPNHFQTQPSYPRNKYWTKNVTSRAFTCFHYIHIEKTAPPPGGHISIKPMKTAPPPGRHTNILTNFKLGRGIIGTDVLTKFHEDRTINVASRVFTRQMLTTDARRTTHDGQKAITIAHHEHVVLR
ncbi:hypothetical protein DPMN_080664 [Dreissena polymorpha]|uniref:Uncharacterized protein n=1 Tax=Dreissena polymorpha TaxID=45954 RepID=A0A9D4BU18_DREPO|nr:hypothetical protein DPMN_080664 [Dreissena polymorpha]